MSLFDSTRQRVLLPSERELFMSLNNPVGLLWTFCATEKVHRREAVGLLRNHCIFGSVE